MAEAEPKHRQLTPPWRGKRDPAAILSMLGGAGFGASAADLAAVESRGWGHWVERQLAPDDAADTARAERLAALTLRIRYNAGERWPAVDEARPLKTLDQPIETLWPLIAKRMEFENAERRRPRDEVTAATILRAVHSRWQLREVMTSVW